MSFVLIWAYRRAVRLPPWLVGLLLVLDVVALNSVIAMYGAASNPFNAILLVPVVLAFILLPLMYAALVLLVSVAAQSIQLVLLPMHHHDTAMVEHFYSMVISFVITSGLIAAVIRYFRYQLTQREQAIHQLRERQLRDEQLLAIGTAAAQLTHEVATPAQSLRLLLEEAQEQQPSPPWLNPIVTQFARIETQLQNWRSIADDVREQRLSHYAVTDLWQSLQHIMGLTRPEVTIHWRPQALSSKAYIEADPTLAPALSSIVTNGCDAATASTTPVQVQLSLTATDFLLTVCNVSQSLNDEQLARLGTRVAVSEKGFGVGAVVSNATIEKFGGEVTWQQEHQQVITRVRLPLAEHEFGYGSRQEEESNQ